MTRYLISILFLAIILSNVTSLRAKDIYVNNATGHDRNLGQSGDTVDGLAGPVRSISRAIELSEQGDCIILAPTERPYRETICLFGKNQSGDSFNAFTIEGNGAILDGSEMLPIEVWRHAFGNTFCFKPTRFTYFQLFEDGRPLKRIVAEPGAKTPPAMNPLEWCICNGFLYVCLDNFKTPQDYKFTYSEKVTGVTIMQTNNVRINDLVVQGYQVDGISIVNNTKNVVLDNVIVRGNGRNGLTIGAASTVSAGYSLFGDNNAAQIDMGNRSELLLYLCALKGSDESTNLPESLRVAQSVKIVNNDGTLRRIGPDGVAATEASQEPDIANLWGKLVPASLLNQTTTTPPSTLTSTVRNGDESTARESTPETPAPASPEENAEEPTSPETETVAPTTPDGSDEDSPFGDLDLNDNPFGGL